MEAQVSKINMQALSNINRIQVRNETLMLLLSLYESKGKTFYYNELFKRDSNTLLSKTLETDIIEISKLLSLDISDARVKLCAKKNIAPKNKDEQLLVNIKKILSRIQEYHDRFELLVNEADELAKLLAKNATKISWSVVPNLDKSLFDYKNTKESFQTLIDLYNSKIKLKEYEVTNLITNFYIDFLNMNVFDNYNDLLALIFMYVMIFQNFPIFTYISFFKYFRKYEQPWQLAIKQANYNWESGFPQTDGLTELIYKILVDSYQELDEIAYQYEFEKDLNKSDALENTILKMRELFTKEDLRRLHPLISDSTISRTLERLKNERKIMVIGAGRASKWQVIAEVDQGFTQLNIFSD